MNEIKLRHRKNKELILFNDAIEYLDKFNPPDELINSKNNQIVNSNNKTNILRDQMLIELNNLKELITNNPDLKFKALTDEERNFFYDFINNYSVCPLCGAFNHYYHLKKFYFNDNYAPIKDKLIRLMNFENKTLHKFNVNFGIPCCTCFKKYFEKR